MKVYKFETWKPALGRTVMSEFAATREAIAMLHGFAIAGSEREVDASLLDDLGRVVIK